MKASYLIVVFVVLFIAATFYVRHLKSQAMLLQLQLAAVDEENRQLARAEDGLESDIQRAQQIQKDIDQDLQREAETFTLFRTTLEQIEWKLQGAEKLEQAVSKLQTEFGDLAVEARVLEELQKR